MQRYEQPFFGSQNGAVKYVSDALVTVYLAGTTTPATIYSDNGVTVKTNPFPASGTVAVFYAANGKYDIVSSSARYGVSTVRDVVLFDSAAAGAFANAAQTTAGATAGVIAVKADGTQILPSGAVVPAPTTTTAAQVAKSATAGLVAVTAAGDYVGPDGSFMPQSSAYVIPSAWASRWKAKLAAAQSGTGLARMACVGDSLTVGMFSSNIAALSWVSRLRTALQAAYGDGGSGYFGTHRSLPGNGGASTFNNAMVSNGSFMTATGTWTQSITATDGPGANFLQTNTAGGTLTCQVRGKVVETFIIVFTSVSGATYSITIDGVSYGTFDSANQATTRVLRQSFTPTPTAGDVHTVVITAVNTAPGGLFVCGFRGVSTTGVVIDNYGRGSYPSRAFANGTNYTFVQSNGTVTGGANQGTFGESGKWSGGSSNPADLVIFSMGLNDCRPAGATTAPDNYLNNLRDFLNDVKDGTGQNGQTDVMIVMQHAGQLSWQDTTKYYAAYCQRAQDIARAYGAAFVNLWALGNNSHNWMLSQGYMGDSSNPGAAGTDQVHLSDAGHLWEANALYPLLSL